METMEEISNVNAPFDIKGHGVLVNLPDHVIFFLETFFIRAEYSQKVHPG